MTATRKHWLRAIGVVVLFGAGVAFFGSGCAAREEPRMGTRLPMRVYEGEQFLVTLDADLGPEYRWRLIQPPAARVAEVVGARHVRRPSGAPGGYDVWTCEARGRGETFMIWHYLNRRDPAEPPARIFHCAVEVR